MEKGKRESKPANSQFPQCSKHGHLDSFDVWRSALEIIRRAFRCLDWLCMRFFISGDVDTSGVTCLAAAILSRFKSGDPEVSRPTSAAPSE